RGSAARASAKAPAKVAAKTPSKVSGPQARGGRSVGGTERTTGQARSATATAARASTRASGGTGSERSKLHAAHPEAEPAPSESRQPSATHAAAAAPVKRP